MTREEIREVERFQASLECLVERHVHDVCDAVKDLERVADTKPQILVEHIRHLSEARANLLEIIEKALEG